MAIQENTMMKSGDLEAGENGRLYPSMTENPQLRWSFIRKVYSILAIQLLLTVAIGAIAVFVHTIPKFMLHTTPGIVLYVLTLIVPFIILCPLYAFHKQHPVNLILLMMFTIAIAFAVGLSCSFSKGRIVLLAGILTSVVVVTLTLYTFWAAKKGYDFSFLGPFLITSLMVLIVFGLIQIFIPLGKLGSTIYGGIGAIIFSGFIIYDTDNLIKHFNYDEYIWAAVCLYLDIINLFLALLDALGGGSGGSSHSTDN
ncbi:Protein LIFEGUARD 4 [Camellia lanceoleosa]|uniref:Protein LIFEGUARD 4 n=1 Tax=Camellia lanceoleosa TaxID=1840588 RepID=A0ACC0GCH4_9ERIC|nr:Protein LIFEGUARD 4 [Camellia lanceoleosa]